MERIQTEKEKILELKELDKKYCKLYRDANKKGIRAMPEVYKCINEYEDVLKKKKSAMIGVLYFEFIILFSSIVFAPVVAESNQIVGLITLFIGVNVIETLAFHKDIKAIIEQNKYLKNNKQKYQIAKQKAKQYEEVKIPQIQQELEQINKLLIEKIELIKSTTDLMDFNEEYCYADGKVIPGVLDEFFEEYEHSQNNEVTQGRQIDDKLRESFELSDELKEKIDRKIRAAFGISYEEYIMLDFDEQQRLMKEYHKKSPSKDKNDMVTVMFGSGEHAVFTKVKSGEKVMIDDGTIIEAGITPEESQRRLKKRFNEICEEPTTIKQKVLSLFKKK